MQEWRHTVARGYWFTVDTGAVKRGITNERLTRAGFFELSPAYESIRSACTGRRVPNGTHGAVRGRGFITPSYSINFCVKGEYAKSFICPIHVLSAIIWLRGNANAGSWVYRVFLSDHVGRTVSDKNRMARELDVWPETLQYNFGRIGLGKGGCMALTNLLLLLLWQRHQRGSSVQTVSMERA